MTTARDPLDKLAQPTLGDLLHRYLQRQATAATEGLGLAETLDEIRPYDVAQVQPVDPRLAWNDAVAVLDCFKTPMKTPSQPPLDWPVIVAQHEPAVSLAFAVGNFPQLVRNLQPFWHAQNLTSLQPVHTRTSPMPALLDWAREAMGQADCPGLLLIAGTLRLAKQVAAAKDLLAKNTAQVPAEWQPAWANEEAALAWHAGNAEEAASLWQAQPASIPVLFNRGMAALFHDDPAAARGPLSEAVTQLPETSAWHHLGRLYLALAEVSR